MFVGFPISEFEMQKGDEKIFVSEKSISVYTDLGYRYTGKNHMGYAAPKWIVGKDKPIFLLLDDFNRGSLGMLQAAMEVVNEQSYVSWSLPKGSTVVLSNNPDDGEYMVTTEDQAQKTRYLNFFMKFDVDVWSEWAEKEKVDGRC